MKATDESSLRFDHHPTYTLQKIYEMVNVMIDIGTFHKILPISY